jgi:Cytochrome C'
MNTARLFCAALVVAFAVSGCAKQESATPVTAAAAPALTAPLPGGLQPAASVLDLMLDPIDSSADLLWEAVATVSTRTGVEEHHPRTDEEWKAVHGKALLLMEGANLLVLEGRKVARPGQQLDSPGGQGDFTPEQAQAAIDADRASFVAFARALQLASGELLSAIEKRDVDAYLQAGGALDEACEACHTKFWYPNAPKPPGL